MMQGTANGGARRKMDVGGRGRDVYSNVATPLGEKSEEYQRVKYLLQMSTRHFVLSDVCIWQFGSTQSAVRFEKRTRNMLTLPAWTSTRRLSEENSLENLHHKGFSFPPSGEGLTFSSGDIEIDPNEGMAHRFLLCQVGVGRSFVVDDPSEQSTIPEGYDSLYLALSTSIDNDSEDVGQIYRHDYKVTDANQVLPMYLVQFFIDSDGRNSEMEFGAANRMDDFADNSLDKLYDRCDFFDPILYVPVSVRDKMIGSHSTGDLAQHKLIGIGDAYESAVSESMKVDPIVASRQEDIRMQLQSIDAKLREVNRNSAAVEEKIYKTLQEALFRLQDITQGKMSALLSEEVELRRELQQIEWMENFLDSQREIASQVEFLNSWKCHVQLRADAVRFPLRTPMVLSHINADLELVGGVQIVSKSVAARTVKNQPSQIQYPQQRDQLQHGNTFSQPPPFNEPQQDQRQVLSQLQPPSTAPPAQQLAGGETPFTPPAHLQAAMENRSGNGTQPASKLERPGTGGDQRASNESNEEFLKRMFSQFSLTSLPGAPPTPPPPSTIDLAKEEVTKPRGESQVTTRSRRSSATSTTSKPPVDTTQFAITSPNTPPKYAQFSLRAEAVRRLRLLRYNPEESLLMAEEAFKESRILQHPDSEVEMRAIRSESGDSESDEDNDDDRKRKKGSKSAPKPLPIPKVFCDAQALLLALPFIRGQNTPPALQLLYASWKPGVGKTVMDIVSSMPRMEQEVEDEEDEDNMKTIYHLEETKTVLIIRSNGRVFGGFADSPWRSDGQTFGTSACFLFSSDLDIKIPFHGRKTLEPPPEDAALNDEISDNGFRENLPKYAVLQSSEDILQFGVKDLVLRGDLSSCSSELEFTFGVGLRPGSVEATTLLAGSHEFKVDELELWSLDYHI